MRLARSSFFSVVQVLVSTASMLVAYRQISTRLGLAELGMWSVISAVAATGRIADLGAGSAIVRLMPPVLARGDRRDAGELVVTSFSLAVLALVLILPLAFPLLMRFAGIFLTESRMQLTQHLLILSLAALVLNAGASCFLGALEAMQRYDQRFAAVVIANIIFIVVVLVLSPTQGLIALALGMVVQALVTMSISWLLVRMNLGVRSWVPIGFHRRYARIVVVTGGPLQTITLTNLAFEPTARLLLARYAGLEWAAIFDVAERLVGYCRSLLLAALQVTTPRFASLARDEQQKRQSIYRFVYGLTWCLGVVGFGLVFAAMPALGIIALGAPHSDLIIVGGVLSIAWHLNTMSAPAYFSLLGGGRLRWIVVAHVVLALANLLLGLWWGADFGVAGVIGAFVLALLSGSALNLVGHHKEFGYAILSPSARELGLAAGVICILAFAATTQARSTSVMMTSLLAAGFSIGLLLLGMWALRATLKSLWIAGAQRER